MEVGGRVETIQTTALLRSAGILRRVLETWADLLLLKLQWKTRRPDLIIITKKKKKKKKKCKIVDFAVPADHRINLKENEKKDKYLDLTRELKKLWNMKVTIVPIVIGALGTITKGLLKGLEDLEIGRRVETIQTRALLRTARILRRVLETWGSLLSLKLSVKPSVNADVKNSKGVSNNNKNNFNTRVYMDSGFKKLPSLHDRLVIELSRYLKETNIPKWMTKGKTTLIQKRHPKKDPTPATTD